MIKLRELDEVLLKEKLRECFIKKEIKDKSSNVLASLITAASKISSFSEVIGEEETMEELMELYEIEEETKQLIGMPPQYVKASIGYSVDFLDYGSAKIAYDSNKREYDEIYNRLYNRSQERNSGKQI